MTTKKLYSEEALEDFIIDELVKRGWKFVKGDELDRDSYENPLLEKDLIRKIKEINKKEIAEKYGGELSDDDINEVLNRLKNKAVNQEGIKAILNYFKEGVGGITLKKQKVLAKIQLFDYENISNNEFIVSRQVYYHNGDEKIRVDVVLYVNGIPLVNIECKDPTSITEDWTNAFRDVKYYEEKVPELYKYAQIGVAACETAKYFPIVPWQKQPAIEQWKVKEDSLELEDPIESVTYMLTPNNVLDIIKNFIFYRIDFGEATKVIPRYMQLRAVNKIYNRVLDKLDKKSEKTRGLIPHWQGSGKTLEIIYAAYKLYYASKLQNPSIFFIVDREELEEQFRNDFNALDMIKPEIINSIEDLKEVIKHDNYKGKRGLFLTMIYKFRPEELREVQEEMDKLSKTQETLVTRENIIAFIDEAHRTQYGQLAGQRKSILGENTFVFGFTGTPISKPGKGVDTYREFSYPDEKSLDRYSVSESWKDGFTLRIAYQPALENIPGIHLKKEDIDSFLEQDYDEIPEIYREDVKDGVKKRLNLINAYLEQEKRIKQISEHIAKHYKEELDGKFKAMIVAPSRRACVMFKKELDKLLPGYSDVVISYDDKKDSSIAEISEFKKDLFERFKKNETSDIEKDIIEDFKKQDKYPKIIIVKSKLLQGFNAPILQTIYLTQPLKEHRLLQAITRTNRLYGEAKAAGVIIDYVGILKDLDKAFEMYDSQDVKEFLYSIERLREEFEQKIKLIMNMFKDVSKDKIDRVTLLKTIELLSSDENLSREFIKEYKELRKVFELLGADTIKVKLAFEYGWVTQIYMNYIKSISSHGEEKMYIEKYFRKTLKYIHENTQLGTLNEVLPTIKFDEDYLSNLNKNVKDKETKATSAYVETMKWTLVVKQNNNAVYETVSDKADRLLKLWKNKVKDYDRIYELALSIWREKNNLEKRRNDLKLNELEYKFLMRLENSFGENKEFIEDSRDLYKQIDKIIFIEENKFPNWASLPSIKKNVQRIILRFLRKYLIKYTANREKIQDLYEKILEDIINNS